MNTEQMNKQQQIFTENNKHVSNRLNVTIEIMTGMRISIISSSNICCNVPLRQLTNQEGKRNSYASKYHL